MYMCSDWIVAVNVEKCAHLKKERSENRDVLYMAVSVMQAGVTCTSFSLTTQLESGNWKKTKHGVAPKLVAYALMRSFSHVSHQGGHDSLSPIVVYTIGDKESWLHEVRAKAE